MSRAPRSGSARRDWGHDDSGTPILHVDMDAFFVEVELLERPELRGLPVAVGGLERGVISSASYEARAFGVNSAMPVGQAKRLCPDLIMIPTSHGRYSEISGRIMDILRSYTPIVEQVSIDEAFLDVSGDKKHTPSQIAAHLRWRIRNEERVPASVGIAATKHVAKIASAHAKPDGMLLVPKTATLDFLGDLPIGALWGVGDVTRSKLENAGIRHVRDLWDVERPSLERSYGVGGAHLWDLAHGIDPRPVRTTRDEKSIGKENTFFDPLTKVDDVKAAMLEQAHECARRLRRGGYVAWRISIKVRSTDFTTTSRSHTLSSPTNTAAEIYRVAASLFTMPPGGVRLVGVRAERLDQCPDVQGVLGDDGRTDKVERALDDIRAKFGRGGALPGTLLPRRGVDGYDGRSAT